MNPFEAAAELWPSIAKYKKLTVALLGTTAPLVLFLSEGPKSFPEIVAASVGYVLTNFGVYRVTNKVE